MMISDILSVFAKPITPLDTQNIKVVIVDNDGNERKSIILNELDKQASLTDTRKKLSLNDEILMSRQNSYFWNDNFKNRILSQDDENNCTLQDILIPKTDYYNLNVAVDSSKPNFLEISKRLQLNKGRKTRDNSENTYVTANKSAFTINNPHMVNVNLQSKFERVHYRGMEEYIKTCYELGSVRLSRKDLTPTEGYIRAIEEALDE
ncbi:10168_t:CDS:1, partial [Dentiscutata heterogama]